MGGEWGWVGGGGGWEAGGKLYLPIGLFGVAMSPRSASHKPRQDWRALRDVLQVNIKPIATSHLVPSMSPIVSVMTLHGWQTSSRKADQSALPINATVHG